MQNLCFILSLARAKCIVKNWLNSWSQDAGWLMPLSDSHLNLFAVVLALYSSTGTWLSLIVFFFYCCSCHLNFEWLDFLLVLEVVKKYVKTWALFDCYLSLLWKMHWCLWVSFPISWEHVQINHNYWCIAYWFPGDLLDSIKIREWMGRLKSVLPVLKQSHLFLFSCLLMATGSRDILDIIPTVVDSG